MASNRFIPCAIVTCLLSAAALLGGCSPPLPKTWLPPPGGTVYDIRVSIDKWHAMTASPLTTGARTEEDVSLSWMLVQAKSFLKKP